MKQILIKITELLSYDKTYNRNLIKFNLILTPATFIYY